MSHQICRFSSYFVFTFTLTLAIIHVPLGAHFYYHDNMHIELLGLSGVRIQTNDKTILLSPPTQDGELKASRMKADIVVLGTEDDEINVDPSEESLFTISGPGEYEVSGVFVYCLASSTQADATLLSRLRVEHVTIAHLGGFNGDLNSEQFELFEGCDVLLIPVGGEDVLDTKKAKALIEKIEPRVVIPMHFAQTGVKTKYATAEAFLKEIGVQAKPEQKLKLVKKDLPTETMDTVYLTP